MCCLKGRRRLEWSNMQELRHSGNSVWLRPFVCRRHATRPHLGFYLHGFLRLL